MAHRHPLTRRPGRSPWQLRHLLARHLLAVLAAGLLVMAVPQGAVATVGTQARPAQPARSAQPAQPAEARGAQWPTQRPPAPLPAPDVRFPPYEVRTLDNGLQVMVVLHHEQPAVSVRLLLRSGAAQDPEGKAGLASLLASLLDQGTTSKTALEIASTIDSIGGGLGTGASSDLTYASAVVMKDSFGLVMDLLGDLVRNPAFDPAEIDRQRQQTLSSFQVSLNDPDYVAETVFDRLVYGFSPYSRPVTGTPESVARITREDLVEYHTTYFVPGNAIIGVVGDLTSEEAFGAVERVFGDWEARPVPEPSFAEPPPPTRRLVVVDKPDAVQTEIRAGHVAIPRKHPDYMALNLATKILGGEGSNRLHRVLRSERGLTYGAAADLIALRHVGDLEAETDTRSEASGEVLRLMVDEFWRLQRQRVRVRELSDAQAYLTGHFPLTIETPTAIGQQILSALFYELDLAELDTYRERVTAVTVDDIQNAALEYFHPDRLSIVMVGNAAAFVDQLPALGFGEYELVSLSELDLDSPSLGGSRTSASAGASTSPPAAPAASAPPGASAASEDAGAALLTRAVRAKGGLETLRAIDTVTVTATSTLATPQGTVDAQTTTYIAYPDRFRVEATLPVGQVVQAFAAGDAWFSDPAGVHDAPPAMRAEFQASAQRDLIRLLLRAAAGELSVRAVPPATGPRGRTLEGLELRGGALAPVTLYLDPESGMIVRQTYLSSAAAGAEPTEEEFYDYRAVDGLQVAFRAVVRRSGEMVMERVVREFRVNTPIDPSLFERPSS